jgi:hypothetical protein
MYAVVRTYTGLPGFARRLAQHRQEIEREIQKSPGFVAYYLVDTPDGSASVTVCQTREGVEESVRIAAAWVKENMPEAVTKAPQLAQGEVLIEVAGVTARR